MQPDIHDRRLGAFLDHWRAIPRRDGGLVPHLSDYLDRLHVEIQPWSIIVDVRPDGLPIRLCGLKMAEVVGRDMTGADYTHAVRAEVRGHVIARDQMCTHHPCGLRMGMKVRAATGRVFEDEMLILPVARTAKPGGHGGSLIRVSSLGDDLEWQDTDLAVVGYLGATWVDLGAGVPSTPPWADKKYTG